MRSMEAEAEGGLVRQGEKGSEAGNQTKARSEGSYPKGGAKQVKGAGIQGSGCWPGDSPRAASCLRAADAGAGKGQLSQMQVQYIGVS